MNDTLLCRVWWSSCQMKCWHFLSIYEMLTFFADLRKMLKFLPCKNKMLYSNQNYVSVFFHQVSYRIKHACSRGWFLFCLVGFIINLNIKYGITVKAFCHVSQVIHFQHVCSVFWFFPNKYRFFSLSCYNIIMIRIRGYKFLAYCLVIWKIKTTVLIHFISR